MEEETDYIEYQQIVLDIIGRSTAKPSVSAPGANQLVKGSKRATPDETKQFYQKLFKYLGIPETQGNLLFVRAWAQIEGSERTGSRPTYNPLSTTLPSGATSSFNSDGVRNYPTLDAGVVATANTIKGKLYSKIYTELKKGIPDKATAISLAKKWEKRGGPLWIWVKGDSSTAGDLTNYIADVLAGNVSPGTIHIPN